MSGARPAGGYYFEDFHPGRRFRHATPRTLTEGDAALYIALTGSRFPLHCAEPVARAMGHPSRPLDDLLVFNVAFGKTVPDISYNAVANLGYADVRFLAPVFAGDTLACESEVVGTKGNSSGKSGIVYVRSRATNQHGVEVLSWARWVMVESREPLQAADKVVPLLPREVPVSDLRLAPGVVSTGLFEATGSDRTWEDYEPGQVIDHPAGMTVEAADHMAATRLYQNPARVHFDAFRARGTPYARRLVYGGHVISVCRALSFDGLENAFAVAAIHGGRHANPTFGGDTVYCRHVVAARDALPQRRDVGALRLRMIATKNLLPADLPEDALAAGHDAIVLDLDYTVLVPRRA